MSGVLQLNWQMPPRVVAQRAMHERALTHGSDGDLPCGRASAGKIGYGQCADFWHKGSRSVYSGSCWSVFPLIEGLRPTGLWLNNKNNRYAAAVHHQRHRASWTRAVQRAGLVSAIESYIYGRKVAWLRDPIIGFAMNTLRHTQQRLRRGASFLLLGTLAGNVQAELVLSLEPAQNHLSFSVPLSEPLAAGDQLAVELDGYDVTALLSCAAGDCQLTLPVPLSAGTHPLRAMIFYDNGDIATVLEARVEVAGGEGSNAAGEQGAAPGPALNDAPAAAVRNASAMVVRQSVNALFSSGYRLDEKQPSNYRGIPRLASNGGLSYRGSGEGSNWRWDAELDAIYDSLSENNPDGDQWVLPNYRLAASRGNGLGRQGLALGTYNLARENLLFSAYQRRGAVVSVGDDVDSPLKLDVFALQSEPITGYKSRLGYPSNAQERSSGALLTLSPWQDEPQLLQLSSGLIKGETTDSGTGMWTPDEQARYGGDTWNLAVDSRLGDNSVWLHADYARASFDSDGIGYGQDERSDSAHELLAQFSSGNWLPAGPFDQWNLTLQHKQVGLDYFTLGNLGLPGDLQLNRANWLGYLGNLQLEAEVAQETNNLDDRADVANQTVDRQLFRAYYFPMVDADALPWRLLGVPSLNAGLTRTRRNQDRADAQVVGYDLNDETLERLAGISFYHNRWNWSVQQTWQDTQDYSNPVEQQGFLVYTPPSDQRNRFTTVQLGFMPNEALSISTNWQWNKLQQTDDNNVSRSTGQGLDMAWQIVPQRWRLNASYFRGHDSSSFGNEDFLGDDLRQQTANLQLTWSVTQPRGLQPGLDWFVKTSYARLDSALFNQGMEDWQLLLGFDLRWDTHTQ